MVLLFNMSIFNHSFIERRYIFWVKWDCTVLWTFLFVIKFAFFKISNMLIFDFIIFHFILQALLIIIFLNKSYSSIYKSTIITSSIRYNKLLTNVEATLKQRWCNVVQSCFDIVSTSDTDVVSTLCNFENPTSNFVSFSTSNQRCFNVDLQRWNNVDSTLKYWLGSLTHKHSRMRIRLYIFNF